jgi:hypothetical protein
MPWCTKQLSRSRDPEAKSKIQSAEASEVGISKKRKRSFQFYQPIGDVETTGVVLVSAKAFDGFSTSPLRLTV